MVNDAAVSVGGAAAAAHVNSPDRAAVHPAAEQRGGRRVSNKIGRCENNCIHNVKYNVMKSKYEKNCLH